jgi:hypothetical protein
MTFQKLDPVIQWLRSALSKGSNRVGVSLHLKTETDPVSETSCFSSNYLKSGQWTKSENPEILFDLKAYWNFNWKLLQINLLKVHNLNNFQSSGSAHE